MRNTFFASCNTISDAQAIAATKPLILFLNSKEEELGDGKRSITNKILHMLLNEAKKVSSLDTQDSLGVSEIGELSPDAVD